MQVEHLAYSLRALSGCLTLEACHRLTPNRTFYGTNLTLVVYVYVDYSLVAYVPLALVRGSSTVS